MEACRPFYVLVLADDQHGYTTNVLLTVLDLQMQAPDAARWRDPPACGVEVAHVRAQALAARLIMCGPCCQRIPAVLVIPLDRDRLGIWS